MHAKLKPARDSAVPRTVTHMNVVLSITTFAHRFQKGKQLTVLGAHGCTFGNRASLSENGISVFVHGDGALVNRWNYGHGYGNKRRVWAGNNLG